MRYKTIDVYYERDIEEVLLSFPSVYARYKGRRIVVDLIDPIIRNVRTGIYLVGFGKLASDGIMTPDEWFSLPAHMQYGCYVHIQ